MGRAVLAINWSIWDGERWWVLHISLSLFSCKSRSRMEGWNCIEGADWPIRRTEKEEGRHRLFVDIINHRSGVETSSLRGKRTRKKERKEEKRKKEEEVERQGSTQGRKFVDMQNRFSSAVSSSVTSSSSLWLGGARTPPFSSLPFFPLLLLLLLLYPSLFFPFISRQEREINSNGIGAQCHLDRHGGGNS